MTSWKRELQICLQLCSFLTEAEPVSAHQGRSTEKVCGKWQRTYIPWGCAGGSRAGGSRVGGVATMDGQVMSGTKSKHPCLSSDQLSGELGGWFAIRERRRWAQMFSGDLWFCLVQNMCELHALLFLSPEMSPLASQGTEQAQHKTWQQPALLCGLREWSGVPDTYAGLPAVHICFKAGDLDVFGRLFHFR